MSHNAEHWLSIIINKGGNGSSSSVRTNQFHLEYIKGILHHRNKGATTCTSMVLGDYSAKRFLLCWCCFLFFHFVFFFIFCLLRLKLNFQPFLTSDIFGALAIQRAYFLRNFQILINYEGKPFSVFTCSCTNSISSFLQQIQFTLALSHSPFGRLLLAKHTIKQLEKFSSNAHIFSRHAHMLDAKMPSVCLCKLRYIISNTDQTIKNQQQTRKLCVFLRQKTNDYCTKTERHLHIIFYFWMCDVKINEMSSHHLFKIEL